MRLRFLATNESMIRLHAKSLLFGNLCVILAQPFEIMVSANDYCFLVNS
jgi:hypothetical protein